MTSFVTKSKVRTSCFEPKNTAVPFRGHCISDNIGGLPESENWTYIVGQTFGIAKHFKNDLVFLEYFSVISKK